MTAPPVRPAGPEDADELLRLRVAVLDGARPADDWRAAFRDEMRARLGTDPDLLAFVAPADGGALAACAIGVVHRCYRGPSHPTGRWARIHTVVTDPAHRRRGHARAVTTALVRALRLRGCGSIELRATEAGAPLYRALGFHPVDGYMTLRPGPAEL
ncbi:GNAT family N-acetyltransferase [Kitasatospora xanthocidica]|uniref:GNAT family N-acetyltransferase n=1 Tax=Kitasatospora xanthocidica TaxID=83382 RepID=A0A372ZP79_9ACTN|nr:GNAT family N-acetyltransferase [Kitasatospora xanthocidica]RGD57037.1 GNAT family N-acetyltransferase [Kitasatospora xanthocidica]